MGEGMTAQKLMAQAHGKWNHVRCRRRVWEFEDQTTHPVSLMECMLNCELPISTVLAPSAALSIGPMVLPHEESFLTTNNCRGTLAPRATSWVRTIPIEFVA